jgi:hypothetical protein
MNVWLVPTSNPILNTFLRSIVLIVAMVFGFNSGWYTAYWGAVIHDAISLVLIYPLVK